MFLQIMPTDTIQEATASSTLFFLVVFAIFLLAGITYLFVTKKARK